MFGRDPQGTRRSPVDTSDNAGKLRWRLALKSPQLSSPVISRDGTVYVYSQDCKLFAVAPPTEETAAELKWTYTAPVREDVPGQPWRRPPALGDDGTVYVSTGDTVHAVSAPATGSKGVLKWSYRTSERFDNLSSASVGGDGTVYVPGNKLIALDPQGNGTSGVLKWSAEIGGGTDYPLSIAHDGMLIPFPGYPGSPLIVIQPPARGTNGTLAWSFPEARQQSSVAIAADGTVLVPGYDRYVRAVTPPSGGSSGVLRWSYHTDSPYHTSPAIGADGTVYVAADRSGVFALNPNPAGPDGELKWRYSNKADKWTSAWPAVGADGTIFLAGSGNVHAISPPASGTEGALKWVFPVDGTQVSAPAIGADGTVYVTADDTLYAIL